MNMTDVNRVWVLLLLLTLGSGAAAADAQPATFASLRTAAERGDAPAQFRLAQRYRAGDEVAVDELEGLYWNGRAAQQGHAEAQFNQGLHYSAGRLFPPNLVRAYMWLRLAEARDQPLAKPLIRQIVANMSQDGVAEAERLVRTWEQTFGSEAVWSCGEQQAQPTGDPL